MSALLVAETFASIQGEGELAGVPMRFVRLAGCSVAACPLHPARGAKLCDTAWERGAERTVADLVEWVGDARWCCVTGGEPTDQAGLADLVAELRRYDVQVQLQTAGVRAAPRVDHLVVSPKVPLADLVARDGDELKLPYAPGLTVADLDAWRAATSFCSYWLLPVWQRRATDVAAILALLERRPYWRLALQGHKHAGLR